MIGHIHSIDTFSTLDGPGIRTVIFMQGCPLRCKYCQNPDTWAIRNEHSQELSIPQVIQVIQRGQPYYGHQGGVTFSGGEPLLQADFISAVLQQCQNHSIHTAIDSSLYTDACELAKVMPFTDLFLADIKSFDPEMSKKLTGMTNWTNLNNLQLLSQARIKVWVRYVVVPGWTDNPDNIRNIARFLSGMDNVEKIELLAYHTLGQHKWNMLGLDYGLTDVAPPSPEQLKDLAGDFAALSGKLTVF